MVCELNGRTHSARKTSEGFKHRHKLNISTEPRYVLFISRSVINRPLLARSWAAWPLPDIFARRVNNFSIHFFGFQFACWLAFADVSPKETICEDRRTLCGSGGSGKILRLCDTFPSLVTQFVGFCGYWQSVVRLHISVVLRKRHVQAGHQSKK